MKTLDALLALSLSASQPPVLGNPYEKKGNEPAKIILDDKKPEVIHNSDTIARFVPPSVKKGIEQHEDTVIFKLPESQKRIIDSVLMCKFALQNLIRTVIGSGDPGEDREY